MEWPITIVFALASMVSGLVGAPASRKIKKNTLTRIFALLLLGVSTRTLLSVLIQKCGSYGPRIFEVMKCYIVFTMSPMCV